MAEAAQGRIGHPKEELSFFGWSDSCWTICGRKNFSEPRRQPNRSTTRQRRGKRNRPAGFCGGRTHLGRERRAGEEEVRRRRSGHEPRTEGDVREREARRHRVDVVRRAARLAGVE